MGTGAARLVVSNDVSELARVADWVKSWAARHDVPPHTAERLDLCAGELVTNVITHGYSDGATHQLSLSLASRGGLIALEIQDDGRGFDPRTAERPKAGAALDEARVGGWGIPIVRHFSDGLHYRRWGGRNVVLLLFRLSPWPIDDPNEQVRE
jgi:serine/threonine-protein kinase RsbW